MKENVERFKVVYNHLASGQKINKHDMDVLIGGNDLRNNFLTYSKKRAKREGLQNPYEIDGNYQMKHDKQSIDKIHRRLAACGIGYVNNCFRLLNNYYLESNNPVYKAITAKYEKTLRQMG